MSAPAAMFEPTPWQRLDLLRRGDAETKQAVQGELYRQYRSPILAFLRRSGHSHHNAEDLAHDFFGYCIREEVFEGADPSRGKFRNLVLTALQRFAGKEQRRAKAQRVRPSGGFVSTDEARESAPDVEFGRDNLTPEVAFNRSWAGMLVRHVVQTMQQTWALGEKRVHFAIFQRCMLAPRLRSWPAQGRKLLLPNQTSPPHQHPL